MTAQKHLKQLVRARMAKTGESYSSARRQLLRQAAGPTPSPSTPHYFAGSVPAAAVLRALLDQAGVRNPRTRQPFSEAMVFGLAGGIGAGMFAFHYAKENFSSFYLAGRHLWQDHLAWTTAAATRLGLTAVVKESSGIKPGEAQLRALLEQGRPVMAWVDGYRIVAVHGIDEATGTALVGEGGDEAWPLALPELAAARQRIKSYKNRLLALEPAAKPIGLSQAVRSGIKACVGVLRKGRLKNFTLEAFATWADRLDGSKAADGWEKIFPPGAHLFQGLRSTYECIEHRGTGGGLCRPIFADFLQEAADALTDRGLREAAGRYATLGTRWSELAEAALPDEIAAFRDARALLARKAELVQSDGASPDPDTGGGSAELAAFRARMTQAFPLDAGQCAALRRDLQRRVRELVDGERTALEELAAWAEPRGARR